MCVFNAVKKTQCSCHTAGSGDKSDKLFAAFQGQPSGNSVLPKGSSLLQERAGARPVSERAQG